MTVAPRRNFQTAAITADEYATFHLDRPLTDGWYRPRPGLTTDAQFVPIIPEAKENPL